MRIKELEEGFGRDAYQRDYDSSRTGFGRQHREIDDEANLMYVYKDGRVKQRMISNHEERSAHQEGFRQTPEDALRAHGIIRSKFDPKKWVQKQGTKWVQVHPFGNSEVENEGIASAAMAKLPAFLNTIGKDSQSIAKIQDQITQRIASAGAGNPAVAHLNDAHSLLSQMYKNPTEEQAKAFYQAVQKANGAGIRETATAGATSAANVGVGAVYKNKPTKQPKNKDGTAKNALDMKANLLTGGSIKR